MREQNQQSDASYACYEVKLNRFFNFQRRNCRLPAILSAVVLAVITAAMLLFDRFDYRYLLFLLLLDVIFWLTRIFIYPKCLDVTPNAIKFRYNFALWRLLRRSLSDHNATEEYTVYNIKSIEYLQSPMEKRFHVGRVRICGETISSWCPGAEPTRETHTICGVMDFENTAEWMKEYIRLVP